MLVDAHDLFRKCKDSWLCILIQKMSLHLRQVRVMYEYCSVRTLDTWYKYEQPAGRGRRPAYTPSYRVPSVLDLR